MKYIFSRGMGNPALLIIIAIVIIAGLIYFMSDRQGGVGTENTHALVAMNDGGQDGTVTLEAGDDQTIVTVDVAVGEASVSQPVHIHAGTCDDLGGIDFPLTNLVDGKSVTTLDASLADVLSGDRVVNVHKSVSEIGVYTSCGSVSIGDVMMEDKDSGADSE